MEEVSDSGTPMCSTENEDRFIPIISIRRDLPDVVRRRLHRLSVVHTVEQNPLIMAPVKESERAVRRQPTDGNNKLALYRV